MKIASIFKDFVLTYNRTYETEEGESWLRVEAPTAWVGGEEEQRSFLGPHPSPTTSSCPVLGQAATKRTHPFSHLISEEI